MQTAVNIHSSTPTQCLFPLVSRSLEDILASLVPAEPAVGNKRKNESTLENEELTKPACKRLRSSEPDSDGSQSVTDRPTGQTEHSAADIVGDGQQATTKTDGEKVNGFHGDSPVAGTTRCESPEDKGDVPDKEPENAACTEELSPPVSSAEHIQCPSEALFTADQDVSAFSPKPAALGASEAEDDFREVKSPPEVLNKPCDLKSNQSFCTNEDICSSEIITLSPQHNDQTARTGQKPLAAGVTPCKDTKGIKSKTENLPSTRITRSKGLVPVPNQLFWKNSNNLCWLDSLLVALVNCKSLKKLKPEDEPQRSSVWQLMKEYEDICAAIEVHHQPDRGKFNRQAKDFLHCMVFLFCSASKMNRSY